MCASIGVDPLASGKGFWSNMLDIGDFYYELGVQVWLGGGRATEFGEGFWFRLSAGQLIITISPDS